MANEEIDVDGRAQQVRELYIAGLTESAISEQLGISNKAVNSYLPYTKGEYGVEDASTNAKKIRRWRAKKAYHNTGYSS